MSGRSAAATSRSSRSSDPARQVRQNPTSVARWWPRRRERRSPWLQPEHHSNNQDLHHVETLDPARRWAGAQCARPSASAGWRPSRAAGDGLGARAHSAYGLRRMQARSRRPIWPSSSAPGCAEPEGVSESGSRPDWPVPALAGLEDREHRVGVVEHDAATIRVTVADADLVVAGRPPRSPPRGLRARLRRTSQTRAGR